MKHFNTTYKALFSVEPFDQDKLNETWNTLAKKVGEWMFDEYRQVRCNRSGIIRNWLFVGGFWDSFLESVTAETQVLRAEMPTHLPPKYWTFRLERRDHKYRERVWRTDLGITVAQTMPIRLDISVTLSWFTLASHVGHESPEPQPQSISLLDFLFDAEGYKITMNGLRLRNRAIQLQVGDGRDFVTQLQNPERIFPIILMRPDESGRFQLFPDKFSQLLSGNANVYYFYGDAVDEEMKHYMGFNHGVYRGPHNGISVYQPHVDFESPQDYIRHRFFIFKKTENQAIDDIEKIIYKGVQRRPKLPFRDFVSFREELFRKEKEYRLHLLREMRTADNDEEYIHLLEEELNEKVSQNLNLSQKLEKITEDMLRIEIQAEDLERRLRRDDFERKQLETLVIDAEKKIKDLRQQNTEIRTLSKLPTSLTEVISKIQGLYQGRLLFLPEAVASAKDATFDDLNTAWAALWAMGDLLWELYFNQNTNTASIQQSFINNTGFTLSLGESKMTRDNNNLIQQRIRHYQGENIEFLAHIKVDKGNKYLRIHYHIDKQNKLIVIGHCGNHLDIFSFPKKN
jgi:hypothetical protein